MLKGPSLAGRWCQNCYHAFPTSRVVLGLPRNAAVGLKQSTHSPRPPLIVRLLVAASKMLLPVTVSMVAVQLPSLVNVVSAFHTRSAPPPIAPRSSERYIDGRSRGREEDRSIYLHDCNNKSWAVLEWIRVRAT